MAKADGCEIIAEILNNLYQNSKKAGIPEQTYDPRILQEFFRNSSGILQEFWSKVSDFAYYFFVLFSDEPGTQETLTMRATWSQNSSRILIGKVADFA